MSMEARSAAMVIVVSGKSFSYTGSKIVLNTCCDVVAWPIRSRLMTRETFARPDPTYEAPANAAEDPVTPPVLTRTYGLPAPKIAVFSTPFSPASASGATPMTIASTAEMSMPASSSAFSAASQIMSAELSSVCARL